MTPQHTNWDMWWERGGCLPRRPKKGGQQRLKRGPGCAASTLREAAAAVWGGGPQMHWHRRHPEGQEGGVLGGVRTRDPFRTAEVGTSLAGNLDPAASSSKE